MATSLDSPLHHKEATRLVVSSPPCSPPMFSPGSDRRLWSALRTRVDTILEDRQSRESSTVNLETHSSLLASNEGECCGTKRMKEDSELLLRGFDSIAYTLSLLSNNIDNAIQGAKNLVEPPTLSEMFHNHLKKTEEELEDPENQRVKNKDTRKGSKRKLDAVENPENNDQEKTDDSVEANEDVPQFKKKLIKAKNIAVTLATKAASVSRELKSIKSDLCFMQERCSLLEEENRRLRDEEFSKGIRPEEDELMRLQMEALLAEKSRLATENANLIRENQCLHQLVEYHQLTSMDLSESYEEVVRGLCLDFSSPPLKAGEETENSSRGYRDCDVATPRASMSDDCFHQWGH